MEIEALNQLITSAVNLTATRNTNLAIRMLRRNVGREALHGLKYVSSRGFKLVRYEVLGGDHAYTIQTNRSFLIVTNDFTCDCNVYKNKVLQRKTSKTCKHIVAALFAKQLEKTLYEVRCVSQQTFDRKFQRFRQRVHEED